MPWPFGLFGRSGPATPVQRAHDEWAELEPLRPAGPLEPVARSLEFARGLAGTNPPEPALRPLGHLRSLEAPGGLADLTLPVQRYAGGEELRLRGVRRWRARWRPVVARSDEDVPLGV